MRAPRNGFGVAALVLGILAIVLCWTGIGGIVLGILALIFGILGVRRANRREATNKGVAISGIVTGAIGLVVGIIFTILWVTAFSIFGNAVQNYQDCVNQANGDQAQVQQCFQQYKNNVNSQLNNNG
jgi:heme/copper-type cytochrome/quinol oxidase subunit 2